VKSLVVLKGEAVRTSIVMLDGEADMLTIHVLHAEDSSIIAMDLMVK
jgi:hypothetical protein